jgi:hypothetical protein
MNFQISIITLLATTMAMFMSCSKADDPNIDVPAGPATLSANINGEAFSVSGIQVTAEYVVQNEMVQSLAIVGAKPPLNGVTEAIALAVVSADSTGINSGETYTAGSTIKTGAGEYVYDDGIQDIKALSSITGVATITITKIDYNSKLVSGTFSFNASTNLISSFVYIITDGVFTDVPFD